MITVSFHPEAQEELRCTMEFYGDQSPRLAAGLLKEVEAAVAGIAAMPAAAAQEVGGVRRKVLRRFPYNIVYEIQAPQLTVIAVMHQRQLPGYWKSRSGC